VATEPRFGDDARGVPAMRTTFPILAVLVLAAAVPAQDPVPTPPKPPAPAAQKPLALGDELPKGLSLRTIDGKLQALDDLRGKVIVFHFWSTTCPYEEAAEPKLNALSAEFAAQGAVMFGIAANQGEIGAEPEQEAFETDDAERMPYGKLRKKAKASGVNHAIVVDHGGDKLGKLLDGKTTPHCFVFDKEGRLQYSGALDDDPNGDKDVPVRYLANAVRAVLAGEKPSVPTTKPYG